MTSKLPTYRFVAAEREAGYMRVRLINRDNDRSYFVDMTDDDFAEMVATLRTVAGEPNPADDNEIDALVSALAALTDRVSTLEERAASHAIQIDAHGNRWANLRDLSMKEERVESAACINPFTVDDAGNLRVAPPAIPKVSAAELYAEIARITAEPAADLHARIEEVESAVRTLQASVDCMKTDTSIIRGVVEALYGRKS